MYAKDIFDTSTVEMMSKHIHLLLDQHGLMSSMEHTVSPLSRLKCLLPEEEKLLDSLNNTSTIENIGRSVPDLFLERACIRPDSACVRKPDGSMVSYKAFSDQVQLIGGYLQSVGMQPEDFVGLLVEDSWMFVLSAWSVMMGGGAYVPIDPETPTKRLEKIISSSKMKLLITDLPKQKLDRLSLTNINIITHLPSVGTYQLKKNMYHPKSIAYCIYTSGSTGEPKGVMIEHHSLLNQCSALKHVMFGKEDLPIDSDVTIQLNKFTFDSHIAEIFTRLAFGGQIVLIKPKGNLDFPYLCDEIEKNQVTSFDMIPSLATMFLKYVDENNIASKIKSIKRVIYGGEGLDQQLLKKTFEIIPECSVFNMYGPTECTVQSTFKEFKSAEQPITIGKPLPNCECHILDEHGNEVIPGCVGTLFIGGEGVMRGYHNLPDKNKAALVKYTSVSPNVLYNTGDLAKMNKEGEIVYLGRKDDQVKIRGQRLELGEIQSIINQQDFVVQSLIRKIELQNGTHALAAYILVKEGTDHDEAKSESKKSCEENLPKYMVPSFFIPMDTFPINQNGKVDVKSLPLPTLLDEESITPPKTETEARLQEIWSSVLNLEKKLVSTTQSFFSMGGNSLIATRVIVIIRKTIFAGIAITDIFNFQTIQDLAGHIDSQVASSQKYLLVKRDIKPTTKKQEKQTSKKSDLTTTNNKQKMTSMPSSNSRSNTDSKSSIPSIGSRPRIKSFTSPRPPSILLPTPRKTQYPKSPWFHLIVLLLGYILVFSNLTVCVAVGYYSYIQLNQFIPSGWETLLYFYPLIRLIITTAIAISVVFWKWILMPCPSTGDFQLYGWYYYRWWLFHHCFMNTNMYFINQWKGTLLLNWYYRLLGAKIGTNVQIFGDLTLHDHIRIDTDCYIGRKAIINPHTFENGTFKVSKIHIKKGSWIGNRSVVAGGSVVSKYSNYPPFSLIKSDTDDIEKNQNSQPIPGDGLPTEKPVRLGFMKGVVQAILNLVVDQILSYPEAGMVALVYFLLTEIKIGGIEGYVAQYSLAIPASVVTNFVTCLVVSLLVGMFGTCTSLGEYEIGSWYALIKRWLPSVILEKSSSYFYSFINTSMYTMFMKIMGFKVSSSALIMSTPNTFDPPYDQINIGDQVYLGSEVYVSSDVSGGKWRVEKTHFRKRSFFGNDVIVMCGSHIPKNSIVGSLTLIDRGQHLSEDQVIFGIPALSYPKGEEREMVSFSSVGCISSTFSIILTMMVPNIFYFISIAAPAGFLVWLCQAYPMFISVDYEIVPHVPLVFALFPLAYLLLMIVMSLLAVLMKWILVQKWKEEGINVMSSLWVRSSVLGSCDLMWNHYVGVYLMGTPFLPAHFRLLGAKIGSDCLIFGNIQHHDLIYIGDGCILDEGATLLPHTFDEGQMQLESILVADGCYFGKGSLVYLGAKIYNGVKIDHLTLILREDELQDNSEWSGSPAKHVRQYVS
eukprot:TRINITY_DN2243_c0_g4_i9.p1 TRINITY_DN2243_c0_g4~~TRINITY_DN2243_c0_g4_i9.p1  ORF type:complete len:1604 (+),score=395.10 TRINITY_DN2243_c0_g4_i9:443-4813(+)